MILVRTLILSLALAILAGCGSNSVKDPFEGDSAEKIYNRGYAALERGDYETAINAFQGLEAHYPFGEFTDAAQLNLIFAHYKYDEYAAAMASADRFIRLHPRNKHLDYVYYMRGMIKFNEDVGVLEHIFPIEPSERDITHEKQAFYLFHELLRRYPNSIYSVDARKRMVYLRNAIAHHELYTAQYYFKRGAYLASVNRAKYIVEHLDEADAMPEALAIMVKSYNKLGLPKLAKTAFRVLNLNYPSYTDIDALEKSLTTT